MKAYDTITEAAAIYGWTVRNQNFVSGAPYAQSFAKGDARLAVSYSATGTATTAAAHREGDTKATKLVRKGLTANVIAHLAAN